MSTAVDTPAARASLSKRMERQMEEKLSSVTPDQLPLARMRLGGADPEKFLRSAIRDAVSSGKLSLWFRSELNALNDESILSELGQEAHNDALSRLLDTSNPAPGNFQAEWRLFECTKSSLILGDSCLFTLRADGSAHPICDAESWAVLVFPISPSKCLIGEHSGNKTPIHELDINRQSAACSIEQFFALSDDAELRELISLIASNATLLTENEMMGVVRSVFDE
jgi:hypothetical protein